MTAETFFLYRKLRQIGACGSERVLKIYLVGQLDHISIHHSVIHQMRSWPRHRKLLEPLLSNLTPLLPNGVVDKSDSESESNLSTLKPYVPIQYIHS